MKFEDILNFVRVNIFGVVLSAIVFLIALGGFIYVWNMPRIIAMYDLQVMEKIHEPARTFTKNVSRTRSCGMYPSMDFNGNLTLKTQYCTDHYLQTWIDDEDWVVVVKRKIVYDNGYVEFKMIRHYVPEDMFDRIETDRQWQDYWEMPYKAKNGDKHTMAGEKKL